MEEQYQQLIELVKLCQNETQLSLLRMTENNVFCYWRNFTMEVHNWNSKFTNELMNRKQVLLESKIG